MIQDRPKVLLDDPCYSSVPELPFVIEWDAVPELVRASIRDLSGVQPVTRSMSDAAGRPLSDIPSPGEIEYFKSRSMGFQSISIVVSLVSAGINDGHLVGRPFALTLIPSSKGGAVSRQPINWIEKVDLRNWLETEPAYFGYDPFKGTWELYGSVNVIGVSSSRFLDEIGVVVGQFFLATAYDPEGVLTFDIGMPTVELGQKYCKHREKLLFTPFQKVQARRIWGAETPIELFMVQELARYGYFPQLQMLILSDGSAFPSLYHLWRDVEFRHQPELVTEVDLYFPEERVAVFCDGRHHRRKRQRDKDAAINGKLLELGITPVRVSGTDIIRDLRSASEKVLGYLRK